MSQRTLTLVIALVAILLVGLGVFIVWVWSSPSGLGPIRPSSRASAPIDPRGGMTTLSRGDTAGFVQPPEVDVSPPSVGAPSGIELQPERDVVPLPTETPFNAPVPTASRTRPLAPNPTATNAHRAYPTPSRKPTTVPRASSTPATPAALRVDTPSLPSGNATPLPLPPSALQPDPVAAQQLARSIQVEATHILESYNDEVRQRAGETGQGFPVGPLSDATVRGEGGGQVAQLTVQFPALPKLPNADRLLFLSFIKVMMASSPDIKVAEVRVEIPSREPVGVVRSRIRLHRSAWDAAASLSPAAFWDLAEKENVEGWWR